MFSALLFLHFVGLALGLGTGFAFMRLGAALRTVPAAERTTTYLRVMSIGHNGSVGLVLLIASGLGMMSMRGFGATLVWGGGFFHAKLGLVVLLCGALGYQQTLTKRVRVEQGGPAMEQLPKVGALLLVLSLFIVGFAVAAFH